MKHFLLFALFTFSLAAQERYSQIELPVRTAQDLRRVIDAGVAVDHFSGKIGGTITMFVNATERQALSQHGIPFTVLIDDWAAYYAEQSRNDHPTFFKANDTVPKFFRYGSMGGFLTMSEVYQQLDSMTLLFPALITKKDSIGATVEGRPIYAIKISDNPVQNETGEPEVLYTALTHAREPEGMMTVVYYMWWLLENYGKDAEATWLVNNRQMWFIPVFNADGYEYNRSTNPGGGGNWRKNRRNNGSTFGVDLNRNFGTLEMWNANNGGSSTSSSADDYRGTAPFSEPETRSLANFVSQHHFRTGFNYHTYGNYLIYPWGYSSAESADSLLFRYWTYDMTTGNRYSIGTDMQTVSYSTRGNSDDFMYGDSAKPRIYSMTPEVGTTGFWPAKNLIYPLAQENIPQNKMLAYFAGWKLAVHSFTAEKFGSVTVRFINKGLDASPAATVSLVTRGGTAASSFLLPALPSFGMADQKISVSINSTSPSVTMLFTDSTGVLLNDSVTFNLGGVGELLRDSANTTALWTTGTGWGIEKDIATNDPYFTDSPGKLYAANSDNALTLKDPLTLSGYQAVELKFRTRWSIESVWDWATVEVSTNNGTTWTPLRTRFTRKASGRSGSKQTAGTFGFDAFTPGLDWVEQTADLTPYRSTPVKLRFRLQADGGDERDGWCVDDIRVVGYPYIESVADEKVPSTFVLGQNFPNPFNPSTTILFTLRERARTSLIIYNMLGQQIAVVVDQELPAGEHRVNFDARQLSSGLYFYRLLSGAYASVKTMTLVR